jgi:DNA helicase HerA-like ATPase
VPEGGDDDEGLAEVIQDGFRITRKYGVGWYIVAQSPAGLSNKVIRECRTRFFGRNLGIGADHRHLETALGKDGAEAYQQLAIQGGYFWVCAG